MTQFEEKVFNAVKLIPKGKVTTYGAIACYLGIPKGARAIGNALHKNPTPIVIPCHRVVNSRGMLAKAFVFGGEGVQESFLKADGVSVENGAVDLVKHGWFFEKLHFLSKIKISH